MASSAGLYTTVILLTVIASVVVGVLAKKFGWTSRIKNLSAGLGAAGGWFLIYHTTDPKWSHNDVIMSVILPMLLTPATTRWWIRHKER